MKATHVCVFFYNPCKYLLNKYKFQVSSQQTFVDLQDVLKMSSEHVFSVTILRLPRRLEDVFKTSRKTSSRRFGRRKIVTLKTSSRRLEDMSWRRLEDMSWRRLQDLSKAKKNGCWWYLYLTNLNVHLTNLCFTKN